MDFPLKIRLMTLEDLKMVIKWANEEDWFFCDGDAEAFLSADPNGFFLGETNGEPVCSFAAIKYGDYCFWTLFIVKKEHRGKGYGSQIMQHAQEYCKDSKVLGLDALDHSFDVYENPKYGFKKSYGTLCYEKIAEGVLKPDLVNLRDLPIDQIAEYDTSVFGYPRKQFLETLLTQEGFYTLGVVRDHKLVGYGILRKQKEGDGYFVGPLSADDKTIAYELFEGLQGCVAGKPIYADVFECNRDAVEILINQKWNPVESLEGLTRMYARGIPKTDMKRVYAQINEIC